MRHSNYWTRVGGFAIILVVVFGMGYPAAFVATHGYRPAGWPEVAGTPAAWFSPPGATSVDCLAAFVVIAVKTYFHMAAGVADAFSDGGRREIVGLMAAAIFSAILVGCGRTLEPLRHAVARFGDAKFASQRELRRMSRGIEIGINPATSETVRIQVEGNLVTIGPPRTGKSAGLILPNLIFPEEGAWFGPTVVIDPKGEIVQAVRRRREALGRKVRILDPVGIVGTTDRWNPLLNRDPKDILYLQSTAKALFAPVNHTSDAGAFFNDCAVCAIVAALVCTVEDTRCDVIAAANLVSNHCEFRAKLRGRKDRFARAALSIFDADDRTRSNILTTVEQAFAWASDERLQRIVQDHTFEVEEIVSGNVDWFIVVPADGRSEILAPYVRWLLSDLFATIRKHRVKERILIVIDEANTLGKCDFVVKGMAELPGFGATLWLHYQTFSMLTDLFGVAGSKTIMNASEVFQLFNLSHADEEECERWSKALGTFTGSDPISGEIGKTERQPVPVRLVPPSELPRMTQNHSLVFINSRRYTTDPLRLRKTQFDDPRFRGLLDGHPPIGPTMS